MKYADLISFDPIEDIVQIREADDPKEAARLVQTYKFSDGMVKNFQEGIIPQLDFTTSVDKKGLLIVGNYGTGKSHLMAAISALAEHADMIQYLDNKSLKKDAEKISGQFKVIRIEIGAVKRPLGDIICRELETNLKKMGVKYQFPAADTITNHKDAFIAMMGAFQEKYPDKGLLLVVDELLDFLRSKAEGDLILDLGFLREVGESCRWSRFRIMAGIQEALFDNPRFEFVAEPVKRVQARYQQIRIVKEDISFVVSERLLKKNSTQKAKIRAHLQNFAPLYGDMNERLEEYVNLFPVHPAYLELVEKLFLVEKRDILKSLSRDIKSIINSDVPKNDTGIFSYDRYWETLKGDASVSTNSDIRNVLEKGQILESIIQRSFPKPHYLPSAVRIIHALGIHRLYTQHNYSPVGLDSERLRDDLCIYLPLPEKDADFLKSTVETIVNDIHKTVSGQFISQNEDNGQFYLDLKKDIDYDAKIASRGELLDNSKLDHYYFDALAKVVKRRPDDTYVRGYKIWTHELIWKERNCGRNGYLFFGAPNQRSTAQPQQDFYLYFIQPFDPPEFEDETKPDEVFLYLVERSEEFDKALRLYSGAKENAGSSSAQSRTIYEEKALDQLKIIVKWLKEHMFTAFDIVYLGERKKLVEWTKGAGVPTNAEIDEIIDRIASFCLAPHFEEVAPEYPKFPKVIRLADREEAVKDALKYLKGGLKTQRGDSVLDGLELLDGDQISPEKSRYAQYLLKLMKKRGDGQVINHSELFEKRDDLEFDVKFHLEPELFMIVIAALVYHGDLVIAYPGKKIDPTSLDELSKMSIVDLVAFKHLEQPKSTPIETLVELFSVLGLTVGLVKNADYHKDAIKALQTEVGKRLTLVVETGQKIRDRYVLWNIELLTEQDRTRINEKISELKTFLESLQKYNTEGKLKNFPYQKRDIKDFKEQLEIIEELSRLTKFVDDLTPLIHYLSEAEVILPGDNPVRKSIEDTKKRVTPDLQDSQKRADREFRQDLITELTRLKREYINEYMALHKNARLGVQEDELKKKLMKDQRLAQLNSLAGIEILPKRQLAELQNMFSTNLIPCFTLTEQDLETTPICKYCRFRPLESISDQSVNQLIYQLEDQLETIYQDWILTLRNNLDDPMVKKNLKLLSADDQGLIQEFIETKTLPDELSAAFIRALQDVFSGLVKVTISLEDLKKILMEKGSPCTVEELQKRFEEYLASLKKGKDAKKIRIVVE
jgi:hypothetical protein